MDKEKVDSRRKEKYERRKNLTLLELWKLGRKGASSLFIPLISCPEHRGACLTGRNQKFRELEQLAHQCPGVLSTSPIMGKSDLLPNGAYKGFIKCPDSPHGTHPCLLYPTGPRPQTLILPGSGGALSGLSFTAGDLG